MVNTVNTHVNFSHAWDASLKLSTCTKNIPKGLQSFNDYAQSLYSVLSVYQSFALSEWLCHHDSAINTVPVLTINIITTIIRGYKNINFASLITHLL